VSGSVTVRITFKTAVTVYKCLYGPAPPYLTEHCTMTSDADCLHLRSANARQLVIPWTKTVTAASLSVDQLCGIVYLTICGLQTPRWTRSRTNWEHFCLMLTRFWFSVHSYVRTVLCCVVYWSCAQS